jgi:hypothetical protein
MTARSLITRAALCAGMAFGAGTAQAGFLEGIPVIDVDALVSSVHDLQSTMMHLDLLAAQVQQLHLESLQIYRECKTNPDTPCPQKPVLPILQEALLAAQERMTQIQVLLREVRGGADPAAAEELHSRIEAEYALLPQERARITLEREQIEAEARARARAPGAQPAARPSCDSK